VSTTTTVKPNSSRWETLLLVAGVIGLLSATGFYVTKYGRENTVQELQSWQISAFSGLSDIDQSVYSSLYTAQEDIGWIQYEIGPWPSIEDLEYYLIPPFVKDITWENTGRVKWEYRDVVQEGEMQGYTLYHGSGGTVEGQSGYIIVIGHLHAGNTMSNHNTIWMHENPNQPMPSTSKTQSLVLEGWKNVVPYSGRDELERLKGSDI
jgi:hypothetical protein